MVFIVFSYGSSHPRCATSILLADRRSSTRRRSRNQSSPTAPSHFAGVLRNITEPQFLRDQRAYFDHPALTDIRLQRHVLYRATRREISSFLLRHCLARRIRTNPLRHTKILFFNAATESPCWSTRWTGSCFEAPRRHCPVPCDHSFPCSATLPANTSRPVQKGNLQSERRHRSTLIPQRRIACVRKRCDRDRSSEQRRNRCWVDNPPVAHALCLRCRAGAQW